MKELGRSSRDRSMRDQPRPHPDVVEESTRAAAAFAATTADADDLGGRVEVAADVRLSFNGRTSRQFTDPEVVISERRSRRR